MESDQQNIASQKYEKLTPREHVLRRPEMYVGSTACVHSSVWSASPDDLSISYATATLSPAFLKVFDEIIVNATDNALEAAGTVHPVTRIDIIVDATTGVITIGNDGPGIPVVKHAVHDTYIPEMIFGQLLTGKNFGSGDDLGIAAGRHGYGAKLTNLFSKHFVVDTICNGARYRHEWDRNMERTVKVVHSHLKPSTPVSKDSACTAKRAKLSAAVERLQQAAASHSVLDDDPRRTPSGSCASSDPYFFAQVVGKQGNPLCFFDRTVIQFTPDMEKLGMTREDIIPQLEASFDGDQQDQTRSQRNVITRKVEKRMNANFPGNEVIGVDTLGVMLKRTMDLASCFPDVVFTFNGQKLPCHFDTYLECYARGSGLAPRSFYLPLSDVREAHAIAGDDVEAKKRAGAVHGGNHIGFLIFDEPPVSLKKKAMSMINGVVTPDGGTHLQHATDLVVRAAAAASVTVLEKDKGRYAFNKSRFMSHCFVVGSFVTKDPRFDSQSKTRLVSKHEFVVPSTKQLKALADDLASITNFRESFCQSIIASAPKTNMRLKMEIAKAYDATLAGTSRGTIEGTTLIVTEGDSGAALVLGALSAAQRRLFGVFPLRGKILNVRSSAFKMADNAEWRSLVALLGLRLDDPAPDRSKLRYQRLLILTDQDPDGMHIRGLIVSAFIHLWPSLAVTPGFLAFFSTPLVKVFPRTSKPLWFYTLQEFEHWRRTTGQSVKVTRPTRYYKGLGTSTTIEGREYFNSMEQHVQPLVFLGDAESTVDGRFAALFDPMYSAERRSWLAAGRLEGGLFETSAKPLAGLLQRSFSDVFGHAATVQATESANVPLLVEEGTESTDAATEIVKQFATNRRRKKGPNSVDIVHLKPSYFRLPTETEPFRGVHYTSFLANDFLQYALYDNFRKVPCAVDGLRPSARKVMWVSLTGAAKSMRVSQMSGIVSQHMSYHHGEVSLQGLIIGLAQDFVGSNNIPLLLGEGQFGSRLYGGGDHAAARYIFARRHRLAEALFPAADLPLLPRAQEDGELIEPHYFLPIIPLLLANGDQLITIGHMVSTPPQDPLRIIGAVRHFIESSPEAALEAWDAATDGTSYGDSVLFGKSGAEPPRRIEAAGDVGATISQRLSFPQQLTRLEPWYNGFLGSLSCIDETKPQYLLSGRVLFVGVSTSHAVFRVVELPPAVSVQQYVTKLSKIIEDGRGRSKKRTIQKSAVDGLLEFSPSALHSFINYSTQQTVDIELRIDSAAVLRVCESALTSHAAHDHLVDSLGLFSPSNRGRKKKTTDLDWKSRSQVSKDGSSSLGRLLRTEIKMTPSLGFFSIEGALITSDSGTDNFNHMIQRVYREHFGARLDLYRSRIAMERKQLRVQLDIARGRHLLSQLMSTNGENTELVAAMQNHKSFNQFLESRGVPKVNSSYDYINRMSLLTLSSLSESVLDDLNTAESALRASLSTAPAKLWLRDLAKLERLLLQEERKMTAIRHEELSARQPLPRRWKTSSSQTELLRAGVQIANGWIDNVVKHRDSLNFLRKSGLLTSELSETAAVLRKFVDCTGGDMVATKPSDDNENEADAGEEAGALEEEPDVEGMCDGEEQKLDGVDAAAAGDFSITNSAAELRLSRIDTVPKTHMMSNWSPPSLHSGSLSCFAVPTLASWRRPAMVRCVKQQLLSVALRLPRFLV